MSIFVFLLELCRALLSVVTTSLFAYQIVVGAFGFKIPKKAPRILNKQHTFAIIVSARNEEFVVGHLIDSLMNQNYPRECFDVFLVADNCTDATAEVARQHGALVYERYNTSRCGKGWALNWIFRIIEEEFPGKYDAACVFDADNIADENFLTEMNHQLCAGSDVAQGYRDTKNPSDSWVSGNYAIYWMIMTRFYHGGRMNLGLSALVGGTGFMFRMALIRESGWCTGSICEDSEFALNTVAAGRRITLAYDARFYDEQPVLFSQSVTQRYRWAVGNLQCIRLCLPNLIRSVFLKGNLRALDALLFVFCIPSISLVLISYVCQFLVYSSNVALAVSEMPFFLIGLIGNYVVMTAFAVLTLLLEKKPLKDYYKALLTFPVFFFTWSFISFVSLLYRDPTWRPIAHTKSVSIEQIKR